MNHELLKEPAHRFSDFLLPLLANSRHPLGSVS
jgi:hypothetical protein